LGVAALLDGGQQVGELGGVAGDAALGRVGGCRGRVGFAPFAAAAAVAAGTEIDPLSLLEIRLISKCSELQKMAISERFKIIQALRSAFTHMALIEELGAESPGPG
jgi:hypothetical protein